MPKTPREKRGSHRSSGSSAHNFNHSSTGIHGSRHSIRRTNSSDFSQASTGHHHSAGHASQFPNASNWSPGQEFSRIAAYDPILDIIHAHKYVTERKPLKFYQVFRYARFIDWMLMLIGLILAILGSMVTPWLYYWAGVTIHDILIFERCNATLVNGQCTIPYACGTTIDTVGKRLFFNIFYGWITYNVLQLFYCMCFTLAADRQTKAMRAAYFESIVRKDMAWFDINADKDFAKEMNTQITQIRLGIGEVIPTFVNLVCTVAAMIVIVFLLDYWVAISFLSFIPISMAFVCMGNWAERKRAEVSDKLFEKASVVAKESLVNIKVIKMYEGEQKQSQRFGQALDDHLQEGSRKKEVRWIVLAAISSASIWLLLNLATALVFWLGQGTFREAFEFCDNQKRWGLISMHPITSVYLEGAWDLDNSPGEILVVYFGLMYLTLHAMEVPNFLSMMKVAHKNANGVFFIIDWKSRIDNTSNEGKTPKRNAVGRLDFNNVTFRYPQKPDVNVLNIKQLTIYSGQYVAFAGPDNSGKNTILKLIPRLYDTCSGFIALDAVNLQNYNIHWLRKQMCIISEAPVIFSGTISENILFGKLNASEDEIIKACELAEVHHVIEKLPQGYNTIITGKEFGDHLTRNQKRQVCLARAYLHRSRLILLDNPVQPENDELEPLLLNFVHHFRDTATVILASTNVTALSKRADCIYYMEDGRIIEIGNHVQLIQAKGKYYSRLEGTMNTSIENRNRFDSQLKAYKFSQLLQKKRVSSLKHSLTGLEFGEENNRRSGSGEKPSLWKNLFGKKAKSDEEIKGSFEASGEQEGGNKRKSILRRSSMHSKPLIDPSTLEQTYRDSGERRASSAGGHMHQGFGMMGFQRMNFARPMTNYSSQVQKTRKTFSFELTYNFVGSHNLSMLRKRRHTLHHNIILAANTAMKNSKSPTSSAYNLNEKRSGHKIRFGGGFGGGESNDKKKGLVAKPKKKQSLYDIVHNATHKVPSHFVSDKKSTKGSGSKRGAEISSHSKMTPLKSKVDLAIAKRKKERDSVQAMLDSLTNPNAMSLNENVELDNVSIESQELDTFLAEYDEAVYSTLRHEVKGFWRDVFKVAHHDWAFIIPGILTSILLGISIPYQTWIVGTFFETLGDDAYIKEQFEKEIWTLIFCMVITGVVTGIAAFIQEFFFAMAGRRMVRKLREVLFVQILKQDLSWFDERDHDIGILILQLYADTTIIQHTLLMSYGILIQVFFNVITSMTFAWVESPSDALALIICCVLGMPILIAMVYFSSKRELHEAEQLEERFRMAGHFAQEFLMNLKTWFSLGAESFFISQHKKLLDKEYTWLNVSGILFTCLNSTVKTSSWFIYAIFILVTLTQHNEHHHAGDNPEGHSTMESGKLESQYPNPFTTPTIVGFIMIISELLIFGAFRVGDQISILTDVESGKTAAHKILRILVNKPETEQNNETAELKDRFYQAEDDELLQPPPEIGLTDVTFVIPGSDPSIPDERLTSISMTINSSSYVAIVGPPGSGKSTLCNLLLRMGNPTCGVIDFNGDDCQKYDPKVIRRLMGLVEYDPCLFDYSILENIQFGKCTEDTTKNEVEEATKLCNCHFDILDLPQDYETLVGDMDRTAHNFSLKQRISFARAMLRKPKILVIDDATTSVDTDTDHKILQVIANVREGRTLVVFSHKIEPIRDADMIFVIWDGELVESGSDMFLLSKKGYYYEMLMTQKVLQDSMRNSPQQLSTIRYNIKKVDKAGQGEFLDKQKLAELASRNKEPTRKSSLAFVNFLDEKVDKMKAEKERRRKELERELPQLEQEEKNRELARLNQANK